MRGWSGGPGRGFNGLGVERGHGQERFWWLGEGKRRREGGEGKHPGRFFKCPHHQGQLQETPDELMAVGTSLPPAFVGSALRSKEGRDLGAGL